MNKFLLLILDIFFPNRCPICSSIIEYDKYVCGSCLERLKAFETDGMKLCDKCGKDNCICGDEVLITKTVSLYVYSNEARDGIISLKGESKNFGYHLGKMLGEKIHSDEKLSKADLITAVPMSRKKRRARGYDQAEVIAKAISEATGIPYIKDLLHKHDSQTQHFLNAEQRRNNTDSFYADDKKDLIGKNIIICDDVITTGSTINKCARLLKNINAGEVYAASGTITLFKKE